MELRARIERLGEPQREALARRLDELGVRSETKLVAYVVPDSRSAPTPEELRRHLRERLPEPMVPAMFVTLDAMPRTVNGKIDRDALPEPATERATSKDSAPRDALEETLVTIFSELLGVEPVGIHDDFFDLGGHSLRALRLVVVIRERLGQTIQVDTVFQRPTVARLAEVLQGAPAVGRDSLLVEIQPRGSQPPLFCAHCVAGRTIHYYDLARELGSDQPVYGLAPPGADGSEPFPESIEQLAARHVAEIRSLQPKGPYRLGGYSFGGVVAFEIARQLTDAGEGVEILAMFDTLFPWHETLEERAGRHRANTAKLGVAERLVYFGRSVLGNVLSLVRDQTAAMRTLPTRLAIRGRTALRIPLPESLRPSYVERSCLRAFRRYRPQALSAPVILFRHGAESWFKDQFPELGWRGLAKDITLVDIPGDHEDVIHGRGVEITARRLGEKLKSSR